MIKNKSCTSLCSFNPLLYTKEVNKMSNPNIPNITPLISISTAQIVPLLLASVALEELALAHLLNAEAEKTQFVLGTLTPTRTTFSPAVVSLSNLLDLDTSVQRTLRDVIKKEMLLEYKFENVLDLIETIETIPSCPGSVTDSNGITIQFTGLTNGGLTWNYQLTVPTAPISFALFFLFPCAVTSFVSCTANPAPEFCGPVFTGACTSGGLARPGIEFLYLPLTQTTATLSFTLNQQFPIGTIDAATEVGPITNCFNICGPICS